MVSDTTLLSLDQLLRPKHQPWFCER
jgi:hypothetical protein